MATLVNTSTDSMVWSRQDQPGYLGILRKSVCGSQKSFETKSSQESPELMRRQEFLSFSLACCLCGKKGITKNELPSAYPDSNILFHDNVAGLDSKALVSQEQSYLQEGLAMLVSGRQPISWVQKDETGEEDVYYRAPRWKQILRKLRAEARRMTCVGVSPAFQYDPLSYAMNFDDTCDSYGHNYIHSLRFSAPMALEIENLHKQTIPRSETALDDNSATWREPFRDPKHGNPSLWKRRRVSEPPRLDLNNVRIWRPAYRK